MSTAIFTGGEDPSGSSPSGAESGAVARRERRWGLAFVSPWLVGLMLLFALPLVWSLVLSFTDYELADQDGEPTKFVGLENWSRLLGDSEVTHGAWITLRFALVAIPLGMILPLALAYLMTSKHLWGRDFFRAMFYLPTMVPFIAAIIVWRFFLNGKFGWFAKLFGLVGVDIPDFTNDPRYAMVALWLIGTWGIGNAMIVNIAALNGVPKDLYEAAMLDGAGSFRLFKDVTIPMISPIIFYNLVLSLVGLGQYFVVPFALSDGTGNPDGSVSFYTMYFYRQTFKFFQGGYGAALAWAMFIVIFALTALLLWSAKFWVHYEYEEK
jgi:multiple sugar transport system permease protein